MYEDRRGRSWRRAKFTKQSRFGSQLIARAWRGDVANALRPVCNGVTVQSTAMRRAFVSALVLSALSVPASLRSGFGRPPATHSRMHAAPPLDQSRRRGAAAAPQQRVAQTQSNLGGGFIQFLFGGAAREPLIQRPFQPLPEPIRAATSLDSPTTQRSRRR